MSVPLAHDELLLHAFRYLAGELSAAESEAFELRLADDEAAQQALTDVVQLSACIAEMPVPSACIAEMPPPSAGINVGSFSHNVSSRREAAGKPGRGRQIMAAALAGATIACGLFVLTGGGQSPPQGPGAAKSGVTPRQAKSMVALWNELHFDEQDRPLAEESFSSLTGDDDADAALVPDWMLAAVAGLEPGALPDSEPEARPGDAAPELDEEVL